MTVIRQKMRLKARFVDSHAVPVQVIWQTIRPIRLSWTAIGGCEEALLWVDDTWMEIEDWADALARPVEVVDEHGQLLWWGWVEAVSKHLPSISLSYDLDKCANRVAVLYRSLEPGQAFGEWQQTAWVDDLESQAVYGIKERLLKVGVLSVEQAEHWRDIELKRRAFPNLELNPGNTAEARTRGIYLRCKGWLHRLNWRVWQCESGVTGNTVAQSGSQAIGDNADHSALSQSFLIKRKLQLSAVSLRLRKVGTPGDQLRVDVRLAEDGSPVGGNLLSCRFITESMANESYTWLTASFPVPYSLDPNKAYCLVISRTGAVNNEAYYVLGLDEHLHYADGQMKLFRPADQTWQPRDPAADALFKLTGLSRVEDEIEALLSSKADFLSGFALEKGIGLLLPAVGELGAPAFDTFKRLLALGTDNRQKLMVAISPSRFLRVFSEPDSDDIPYFLTPSGEALDRLGQPVSAVNELVGKRVKVYRQDSFLVEGLILDAETGVYQLKTHG